MNSNEPKLARADSYDDLANDYERVVVPILRPMAKRLLQFIDVRPGWRVLDAGTGTGLLALAVAPRVGKTGKIIGIDLAEKMLAIARRKAAQFGFEQCEFRRGDLENLDFTADSFDVVLSQFALHHTNFPRALAEIARVLKPSGVFVMQDWSNIPIPAFEEFFQTLATFRAADESEMLARGRAQSERTREFFDSFGTELGMRTALNAAGFTQIETHVETYSARVNDVDAF
ncbi:MAG: methyltransferase domain-containing protein, partial [Chloroflexi bacterium]|nr:methyltransferase domain-containing protein [Chloroflexota bacterium]